MRNEHLKTRLIDMDFSQILARVTEWKAEREFNKINSVQPAKKKAKKKKATTKIAIEKMSPAERVALLKELEEIDNA